ncbi:MAG: CapA family protein [Myxococcota bacterium]
MNSRNLLLLTAMACKPAPPTAVQLEIFDRRERPAAGATFTIKDQVFTADASGTLRVELPNGPLIGVVEAEGLLAEPVVLGPEDLGTVVTVQMYRSDSHWAMHAGGDVMFGRRYQAPTEGAPLVPFEDAEAGSRAVVSDLAAAFAAADISVVNFESVLGPFDPADAYPGKRFLLASPAGSAAGLQSMGVDAVDLANNHVRDWLDPGVQVTLDALDDAGLPSFGGGMDVEEAMKPLIIEVNGLSVGFIGFTSVDGSFVNDRYPVDGDAKPADVPETEEWLYETRTWGFEGETLSAPVAPRRPGSAWRVFSKVESQLSEEEAAAAWASLEAVYPELQDWVARRGHGGAAKWDSDDARRRIAALDAQVDVVVVQIHGGFQFAAGISKFVDTMTATSVEAGADLVIGHHPHVLQGASYHDGALVVHSLGNLVFDQDFLATYPSATLRTVWNADTLVEARLIPVELVGYRPVPLAGDDARSLLRGIWDRSQPGAQYDRVDGSIRPVEAGFFDGSVPAAIRWDRHTALLVNEEPTFETIEVKAGKESVTELGVLGLVDPRLGLNSEAAIDVSVGRDLFRWGIIRDGLADGRVNQGTHWALDSADERLLQLNDGQWVIELERDGFDEGPVLTRPVARIPFVQHRLWSDDGQTPLDPVPQFAIRLRARATGAATSNIRLVTYDFFDTDPTADPFSTVVADVRVELDVGRRWREIVIPFEPEWVSGPNGSEANMVLPYLELEPPRVGRAVLQVADFQVLELRRAADMPSTPGAWDVVWNPSRRAVDLSVPIVEAP